MYMLRLWRISLILLCFWFKPLYAASAIVAVANNFYGPMKALNADFSQQTEHALQLSTGSTGQLYAQIVNGAPFDLFFAADTLRPQTLIEKGLGSSSFTYAQGCLVLWSTSPGLDLVSLLTQQDFTHLAIADPKLAPYGLAAQQSLSKMALWQAVQAKLVLGNGLNPTYQFIASGNAELGFVAKSQVFKQGQYREGSVWQVPIDYYQPILQDAVILRKGQNNPVINAFINYLKTERAQAIIKSYGYQ
jgi:molybdate transport system substrate-binding protein